MPYENLALQLKADNWARTLEEVREAYQRLESVPETLRAQRTAYLDRQVERITQKLQEFATLGVRPMPPRANY